MDVAVPQAFIRWRAAPRLIASRYPTAGLFDRVASSADVDAIIELEGWTNDRITGELGILSAVPRDEWVVGRTDGLRHHGSVLPPVPRRWAIHRRRPRCLVRRTYD